MRILVVADVHANLEALEAALADVRADGALDAVWCLGDLVGYGPDPGACIELVRSLPHVAVAGNHDLAAAGEIGVEDFNAYAADAARWTALQLSEAHREWLAALPRVTVEDEFTLTHGSLVDPVWEYLLSPSDAAAHLALQSTTYGLVGHSHLPLVFTETDGRARPEPGAARTQASLDGRRLVANPGGLGQPRDGDPRAPYAVLDTEARRLEFRRVAYDFAPTQRKIRAARLPEMLAERLGRGR